MPIHTKSTDATGASVEITKHTLNVPTLFYVPYTGPSEQVRAEFSQGFPPAFGSGLAFKERTSDGSLIFLGTTDRGPNGDGPSMLQENGKSIDSKIFSAPSFVPSIAKIVVDAKQAVVQSVMTIKNQAGQNISGRPLSKGIGATGEIAIDDHLMPLAYDEHGLDIEGLVIDKDGKTLWVSDEYGPFIVKIDAATGKIIKKYAPSTQANDLPMVLSQRRTNRGMEGLAQAPSGILHGFIQSPLNAGKLDDPLTGKNIKVQDFASFVRWLAFDPKTESSQLYAYPIHAQNYRAGKTGKAKLGDLVALSNNRFIVIEQGVGPDGKLFNWLMLVEIPQNATNIAAYGVALEKSSVTHKPVDGADYSQVIVLKKTLLMDLNQAGWQAEKAEGLSLVDEHTLALMNDNDFGIRTAVYDKSSTEIPRADITQCQADHQGQLLEQCAQKTVRVTQASASEQTQHLWLIKFSKALKDYAP